LASALQRVPFCATATSSFLRGAIAFPSQNQLAESIIIGQDGDRLYIALIYRLFQKLNDRLGLGKRLYLESSFCDPMFWL
jgi:hypothetical protein